MLMGLAMCESIRDQPGKSAVLGYQIAKPRSLRSLGFDKIAKENKSLKKIHRTICTVTLILSQVKVPLRMPPTTK